MPVRRMLRLGGPAAPASGRRSLPVVEAGGGRYLGLVFVAAKEVVDTGLRRYHGRGMAVAA